MTRFIAAFALLALAGCGLPLSDRGDVLENTCESDEVCGANGMCTEQGICVSRSAVLPGLMVQVDIPSSARYAGGTSSLFEVAAPLQAQSDGAAHADFATPRLLPITKSITLQDFEAHPRLAGCDGLDLKEDTIPIALEILPVARVGGIPLTVYSQESDPDAATNAVTAEVPEGEYRVYVRPLLGTKTDPVENCDVPPALFTSIEEEDVMLNQAQVQSLSGAIITGGLNLTAWTLDLVDKVTGRVISTVQTFPEANTSFELLFWFELVSSQGLDPILRLTPSEAARAEGMPVVFWYLNSVALAGFENVQLDVSALATAQPVTVSGAVYDSQGRRAAHATVIVQSKGLLEQSFGDNIAYKTTVQTNSDGVFPDPGIRLLPGDYEVTALPSSPDLAITTTTWQVNSSYSQSVFTIEVNPKTTLRGRVFSPQGEDAYATPVFVQPTASAPQNFAQSQFNNAELQPTNDTTLTVGDGTFELLVDPGAYDVFVRPAEASSIPWLVIPNFPITPWSEDHDSDELGELSLANPMIMTGQVKGPDGETIAGATLRAWLPLCKPGYELLLDEMLCRPLADSEEVDDVIPVAVQVAETTADGTGAYRLLLPPSVTPSISQ